jgi:dihydrolipoamide dehydrogenase
VWDSTRALELPEVPKSLLVVGGGYIGLEMGSVYAELGTKVTVVEMLPQIMTGADLDIVAVFNKSTSKLFEAVLVNTRAELEEDKKGIRARLKGQEGEERERTFDRVLITIGRQPVTENLGLENTKVRLDKKGFVQVDPQRRTDEPSIYAIGDVVGDPLLAHKASHEGRTAVEAIAGRKVAFEPQAIPAVEYTDPEIAWCGLTETAAREQGREVKVARFPWGASGRAMTLGRPDGLTKLVIDPQTERVLGVAIVGANAGELISEGALAIEMAATAEDLALTIHPHPTLSETLMEAAEVFYGTATDIYRPKR